MVKCAYLAGPDGPAKATDSINEAHKSQIMSTIDPIVAKLPGWAGQIGQVEPLLGGITNQNYKVSVGAETFAIRICAQGVGIHGIDRQVEQQCARAAARIGVAPEVYAFVDELPTGGQALVSRFIEGETLTAALVGSTERLPAVVELLRRYHQLEHFAGRFDVFYIFANCLIAAQQMSAPLPTFIASIKKELRRVEDALQRAPQPLVACHNDLLPANFVQDRQGRLWLLDWEYAGWGDRFFDLGNLSVNNGFNDAQDETLLAGYFGRVTPQDWARLKLMKIVSDAREGIWGMVQWGISSLEFDFAAYGHRHLERFLHHCASADVARWLTDV
jgi:thiamine kinase-like enzyme